MKLHQENFPVQVNGANSGTSKFSIAMNAKAFRVLSDTLYQDKAGSLVREISTNAYDGHIMAGKKDVPFEIHLPDNFEPWFSVRDFGVGLSPSDIETVFTKYFESTKDQSNDTVGAFGLGAKTPFAYTDQFTVTSIYGGVKTIYSAFIDGSGIPSIAEMHSEESDECNGVEIKVAVKPQDFNLFRNAVSVQLRYFEVKPIVKNCDNFKFQSVTEPNDSSIFGEDFIVTPGSSEPIAIQGQIGYTIDRHKIQSKIDSGTHGEIYRLLSAPLSFKVSFPIGEIGVTASRENIEYDDRTVGNIIKKLQEILSTIRKNVGDTLEGAKNGWEKAVMLNETYSHFKTSYDLKYDNLNRNSWSGNYELSLKNAGYLFYSVIRRYGYRIFGRSETNLIRPSKNVKIMFVDTAKPKTEAIENNLVGDTQLFLVFVPKNTDVSAIKKSISDYMHGFDNFVEQKDFVTKVVRQKNSVAQPKTTYYNISSPTYNSRSYDGKLPDEFVYVEFSRGSVKESTDESLIREFFDLQKLEEFEDVMDIKLIGVPVSEMKKLEKSNGVLLADFMKEIKQNAPVDVIAAKYRKARLYEISKLIYGNCDFNVRQAVIESGVEYGKVLALAEKAVNKYQSISNKYNNRIAEIFSIKKDGSENRDSEKISKVLELKSKHPILKVHGHHLSNIEKQELIKLVQVTV